MKKLGTVLRFSDLEKIRLLCCVYVYIYRKKEVESVQTQTDPRPLRGLTCSGFT